MALDRDTVARVATLARIRVAPDELDALAGELAQIVGWIERLEAVDTSGIEPMARVVTMPLPMRPDVVDDGGDRAGVLANGAQATGEFFAVPKVIE